MGLNFKLLTGTRRGQYSTSATICELIDPSLFFQDCPGRERTWCWFFSFQMQRLTPLCYCPLLDPSRKLCLDRKSSFIKWATRASYVRPDLTRNNFFRSHRVVISNLPAGTDRSKVESLLSAFTNLQIGDIKDDANSSCIANVTFATKEDADK